MSLAGLGRLIVEDDRDGQFLMQSKVSSGVGTKYRYWHANGWWGDQFNTSQCVSYSWAHWTEDGPVTHTPTPHATSGGHTSQGVFRGQRPAFDLDAGYRWMQQNDYWPGENYDGTSVRAGAQYLQQQGLISSYYWAWDVETVVKALLELGPVVVGTNWTMDMFVPSYKDRVITPTGAGAGGHAYLLNGVNTERGLIRLKNSWGRNWGNKGHAYISIEDMDKLLRDAGEACIAVS